MRICYLADAESIHTQRWTKFFVKKGHEVHIISSKPFAIKDVYVHQVPKIGKNPMDFLFGIFCVRRLVNMIKPDILHAHYVVKYGWWGALSNYHPLILTVWGSDLLGELHRLKIVKILTKFSIKKADLVTYDGYHLKSILRHLSGNENKLKMVFFGVDVDLFKPAPRDEDLAKSLGISKCPVVISLRSLKPIYGVESLVRAIPLVLKYIPDAKFLIFGKGEQESMLRKLVRSLGIEKSVLFMGIVPNELMPKYLNLADVYVSTALSDAGLAASTAEAMACALPVVVTDFGDNRHWVKDGENGFVVPINSHAMLADRIVNLLSDDRLRKKFGEKNRQIISMKNNYYREMEKMEIIYKMIYERFKK
ncbi:MAG: glycosyltransferase family 4 protein [Candidatus Methanomethyliaceae archaeon]|nr:glycosyltransferase family 4 protein [Candidatus Methanomethyliaceae archaeon]